MKGEEKKQEEDLNSWLTDEYCPNCAEELILDFKKLGNNEIWLKCKKCGVRTELD